MGDAPIAATLHVGGNSDATITVAFIGTTKAFSLSVTQAQRLDAGLQRAISIIADDDGERARRVAINLFEGVEG